MLQSEVLERNHRHCRIQPRLNHIATDSLIKKKKKKRSNSDLHEAHRKCHSYTQAPSFAGREMAVEKQLTGSILQPTADFILTQPIYLPDLLKGSGHWRPKVASLGRNKNKKHSAGGKAKGT